MCLCSFSSEHLGGIILRRKVSVICNKTAESFFSSSSLFFFFLLLILLLMSSFLEYLFLNIRG